MYDSLIHFLNTHPKFKIELASHIDLKTSDSTNNLVWESEYEVESMKKVLVGFGIDEKRINTKGYGNTKRIIDIDKMSNLNSNDQIEARFINTRIEIILISL